MAKVIRLEHYHGPHIPTHVATAVMSIDGERYKYENFPWKGFLWKIAEYQSYIQPGTVLDWLKKNTDKNNVTKLRKEKEIMAQTTPSFVKRKNEQNKRVMMIDKVRSWFTYNRRDCTPVDTMNPDTKLYATKAGQCPKCGRVSLVQYYLPGKKHVARMCMHRFDTVADRVCKHCDAIETPLKPWEKAKAEASYVPV
jgi:hypothetical protein